MRESFRQWLLRRIARREMEMLERYRVAADLVKVWNGRVPASRKTAEWIIDVAEFGRGYDIEAFRATLILNQEREDALRRGREG